MSCWQTRGYHEGRPLCFWWQFQEAFDEGKKTWDAWSGRGELVTDQKVLENVFKGEYDSWHKKAM